MPSAEDMLNARADVRQRAIEILIKKMENPDYRRATAEWLVSKMSDECLVELTGIQKGGAYSPW